MNKGTLRVDTGRPEAMALVEDALLRKGFERVFTGTTGDELKIKQYMRRDLPRFVNPLPTVILTWRE